MAPVLDDIAVARLSLGILVDVDGDDSEVAASHRDVVQDRRHHPARWAPARAELDEHRALGGDDHGVEGVVVDGVVQLPRVVSSTVMLSS